MGNGTRWEEGRGATSPAPWARAIDRRGGCLVEHTAPHRPRQRASPGERAWAALSVPIRSLLWLLPGAHVDVPDQLPLWISSEHNDFLLGLSVSRAEGGTVFKVTAEQWEHLTTVVGRWGPAPVEEAEATRRGRRSKTGKGQGFGLTSAE